MRTRKQAPEAMFKLTVRLPESLIENAKIRAVKERTTLQEMVAEALAAYLKAPSSPREDRG
jgi:predicted DNA binding CopG/RHH family protein